MPTRSLPARPSLPQLKLQVKELRRGHAARSPSAAERILAHHPARRGQTAAGVLDGPLKLADAQLVVAREYGFPSWARLRHHVEIAGEVARFAPHPEFAEALAALDAGDAQGLAALLARDPSLIHARTNLEPPYHYFSAATLLHHVAGNPGRDRALPDNVVELARILLDAGADVSARTLGPNGGTTMGLLVTSHQASRRGFTRALMDLLLERGARLDVHRPDALDGPLANHAPAAAERMIELGAKPDVLAAAALGRMDPLRAFFDADGHLLHRPRRHGRLMSARDAIGLALLYAYVRGQHEAADFLLGLDGNWDMIGVSNGTALHRAAWDGDIAMIERLVARGADASNRANPFTATPLSWAHHNRQHDVVAWFRAHCAIDLHDAVCFEFTEHVEARIREDPASVNRRLDQWDMPRSTPLHWAAWTHTTDVDGSHELDEGLRARFVALLLERGADVDAVAGNGLTPLDVAEASRAAGIIALLRRHGARRAAELPS